jgi:hypothetical protein
MISTYITTSGRPSADRMEVTFERIILHLDVVIAITHVVA